MEVVQEMVGYSSSLPAPEPVVLVAPKPVSEVEDDAATKLQKVYRSYRTRRNLADSAVAAEELWWKALDFVALDRSSISFFEQEKHKTATSKWTRAKVRVAKFGKGLSQNERAHKLAIQHWLEAIDPRHRYGESLHFYYEVWLESQSTQPFFYWLDVGDGKEVNLEKRSRSQLQSQCVQYLGPKEREAYEVIIEDGKFVYKKSRELVHSEKDSRLIFVMSTSKTLYIGKKIKGSFHHSSFLSGAATLVAGGMDIEEGVLRRLLPHSGHYLPSKESIKEFAHFLEENNIDLTKVTKFRFEHGTKSFVVCNSFDEEEEIGQMDQVTGSEPGNQESKGGGLSHEPTF